MMDFQASNKNEIASDVIDILFGIEKLKVLIFHQLIYIAIFLILTNFWNIPFRVNSFI